MVHSDIDKETRTRIREKVLKAEKDKLHLDRAHGIIIEIKEIVESEIDEVEYEQVEGQE